MRDLLKPSNPILIDSLIFGKRIDNQYRPLQVSQRSDITIQCSEVTPFVVGKVISTKGNSIVEIQVDNNLTKRLNQ